MTPLPNWKFLIRIRPIWHSIRTIARMNLDSLKTATMISRKGGHFMGALLVSSEVLLLAIPFATTIGAELEMTQPKQIWSSLDNELIG